jgi:hypothetical protein
MTDLLDYQAAAVENLEIASNPLLAKFFLRSS